MYGNFYGKGQECAYAGSCQYVRRPMHPEHQARKADKKDPYGSGGNGDGVGPGLDLKYAKSCSGCKCCNGKCVSTGEAGTPVPVCFPQCGSVPGNDGFSCDDNQYSADLRNSEQQGLRMVPAQDEQQRYESSKGKNEF